MTDSHPFFRFLWRANALLMFLIAVVVGAFVAYQVARELWRLSRPPYVAPDQAVATPPAKPGERPREVLHLGPFQRVAGQAFAADLYVGGPGDRTGYVSSSYGASAVVRNVLHFNAADGSVRRLLPDDRGRVLEQISVMRRRDGGETAAVAQVFVVAGADSNGDGVIDAGDEKRVLATRPDGSGAVTLAERVGSYGTTSSADRDEPVLVYFIRRGAELTFGEFDLAAFAVKRELPVKVPPL